MTSEKFDKKKQFFFSNLKNVISSIHIGDDGKSFYVQNKKKLELNSITVNLKFV